MTLVPVWDAVQPGSDEFWPREGEDVLIVGGEESQQSELGRYYPRALRIENVWQETAESLSGKLQQPGRVQHVFWITPESEVESVRDERIVTGQQEGVIGLLRLIKGLLQNGYGNRELGLTVITIGSQAVDAQERINPTHASVHGMMGSVAKEYVGWKVRLVDVEGPGEWPWAELLRLPADGEGNAWSRRRGQWYRQRLIGCEAGAAGAAGAEEVYRRGGVYVVIGGAGGIGEVWSEHVIGGYGAQVVWIGRREAGEEIEGKCERLGRLGPKPCYIRADARKREELEAARDEIQRRFGAIHGVIHSAIGLFDQSLAKMDEEHFLDALSAKLDLSVRIAQVFGSEKLDFIVFFSSISSFEKELGKVSYSAGSTFEDAFAHQFARECVFPVKVMNWGYWGKIGAGGAMPESSKARFSRIGIASIEPEKGMQALDRLMAAPIHQMGFINVTSVLAVRSFYEAEHVLISTQTLPSIQDRLTDLPLPAIPC
jgi:polyketide synthase PksM